MISIKKFLSANAEADHARVQAVRILVEGIGRHAAEGAVEDTARFRASIERESEAITDEITPETLLVRAGSVLKELEDYNRNVGRVHHLQTAELRNIVKMLTGAIGAVTAASAENVSILNDIGKKIGTVSQLDDIRVVKARLWDCLSDIQRAAERQHAESDSTLRQLRDGLEQVQNAVVSGAKGGDQAVDPVTGLPLRPAAEAALAEPGLDKSRSYLAVMVLDHLQMLNTRFGRDAGDEIMMAFAGKMKQELNAGDQLFRWNGPVLVALLTDRTSLELARSEMTRRMEHKMEHTIQTPTRTVLLPITVRWCVFPNMPATRLLCQRVDNFSVRAVPATA